MQAVKKEPSVMIVEIGLENRNTAVITYPNGMKQYRKFENSEELQTVITDTEQVSDMMQQNAGGAERWVVQITSHAMAKVLGFDEAKPQKVATHEKSKNILDPFNNWMRHRFLRNERGGEESSHA